MTKKIRKRERTTILKSLGAGVVPRSGLQHIHVGRSSEVQAIRRDLEHVQDGGATFRFVVGRFGSGKTFFLHLAAAVAQQMNFVVASADLTLDRRLHGSKGVARSLYSELMTNLATKAKPDGGALPSIVERWVSSVDQEVRSNGGEFADVTRAITDRLAPLQELVAGYDFAEVLKIYYEAYQSGNDARQQSAIRWLRAEYSTKTDARRELGVRNIIDDAGFYSYLKLLAAFTRIAGYSGLIVNLDELVVLSERLNNSVARKNNYEAILTILNDCLQGGASGIGFILGGTDTFLEDRRRGMFSYEALATRLAPNPFATEGVQDHSGPVMRLQNLSQEDLFVLLGNIRTVFLSDDSYQADVPDEALHGFMKYASQTIGAEYFKTPRDTIKAYVQFLQVLGQNPAENWSKLLSSRDSGEAKKLSLVTQEGADPSVENQTSTTASIGESEDESDNGLDGLVTFTL